MSDEVEAVFRRALSIGPDERYRSAGEFWDALELAVHGDVLTRSGHHPSSSRTPASAGGVSPGAPTVLSTPPGLTPPGAPSAAGTLQATTAASGEGPGSSLPLYLGISVVAFLAIGAVVAFAGFGAGTSPSTPAPSAGSAVAAASVSALASASAAPAPACPEGMVLIEAGQFFMGSDKKGAFPNEQPVHNVTLSAFCMDVTEVTFGAYLECSKVGKCLPPDREVRWPDAKEKEVKALSPLCNRARSENGEDMRKHPVNCVDWSMANRYCEVQGKRLPTEAEWEYATRGPDGRTYPWGDEDPTGEYLNACGEECAKWSRERGLPDDTLYTDNDGFIGTAPVGSFEKGDSGFGPKDVVGNVWEWTGDWYGDYLKHDTSNPTGPDTGERRVIRGGGFNGAYKTWVRPSFRYGQDPKARTHVIGFRCAKSLKSPEE